MDEDGEFVGGAWVMFTASAFHCQQCGLRLGTPAELAAAGMPTEWEIVGADPSDFMESSDDVGYSGYASYCDSDDR